MTQLYKDFRPTQFDSAGLALDSQQDWLVLTVTRTRDSEALEQSNFRTALEILGGESDTCEVHRFGHWGPGWFEIILLHPDRAQEADEIEGALAHYPILSDDDHSELEKKRCLRGSMARNNTGHARLAGNTRWQIPLSTFWNRPSHPLRWHGTKRTRTNTIGPMTCAILRAPLKRLAAKKSPA